MRLPSSHCSKPPLTPSPHLVAGQTDFGGVPCLTQAKPVSRVQVAEQPSPAVVLPSSHCSLPATMPSPHFLAVHWAPAVAQVQPVSTWQVPEQPSPETVLPSSQV